MTLASPRLTDRQSDAEKDADLLHAAHAGNLREVELLLQCGVKTKPINWTSISTPFQLCVDGKNRWSALHAASREGHRKIAERLLDHGAAVDIQNSMLRTPLFYAAEQGRSNIIELLIANGADVNTFDWSRTYPLHIAIMRGRKFSIATLCSSTFWDCSVPLAFFHGFKVFAAPNIYRPFPNAFIIFISRIKIDLP